VSEGLTRDGRESPAPNAAGWSEAIWVIVILCLTFFTYVKTLSNDFTYDDRLYAAAYTPSGLNPMVAGDVPFADYFRRPMGYGVHAKSRGFRPATVVSYAVTHKLFRSKIPTRLHPEYQDQGVEQDWTDPAWPHHLLNLVLHLCAALLAYALVRRLVGSGWPARIAMALFALHAVRSDPVCSIVGRGELLPFVFGASAVLLFERATRRVTKTDWPRLLLVMLCLLIAFLSKESALAWGVMVPLFAFVLRVGDGLDLAVVARRLIWPGVLVLGLPALIFVGLYMNMLANAPEVEGFVVAPDSNPLFDMGLFDRFPTAVMVWGYGLRMLFWPFPLSSDYSAEVFELVGWIDVRFLVSALLLAMVLVGGLVSLRRRPLLFLGMACFMGFGFVTSNIPVPVETIFGERHCYTPALACSFLAAFLVQRFGRPALLVALACTVVSAAIACQRSFVWQDNQILFATDAETHPNCKGLQLNMARLARLDIPTDWDRRIGFLQRILAVDPESFLAHNEMGADLMMQRKYAEARPALEAALAGLQNSKSEMRAFGGRVLVNLGTAERRLGRADSADRRYQAALRLEAERPQSAVARSAWLGRLWLAWSREDSRVVGELLDRIEPMFQGSEDLAVHRGLLAWRRGDHPKAVEVLDGYLRNAGLDEDLLLAWRALQESQLVIGNRELVLKVIATRARWLLRLGRHDEAVALLQEGLALDGGFLEFHRIRIWLAWDNPQTGSVRNEVEKLLATALLIAPKDGELWIHKGIHLHLDGDHGQAAQILVRTVPHFHPSAEYLRAWVALCEALVEMGDLAGAERALREACMKNRTMPIEVARQFVALNKRIQDPSEKRRKQ